MSSKLNNDLTRQFPFLIDLEKELGNLGQVRVKRISGMEVQMVRNLPVVDAVLRNEVREYPSPVEGEGFLVLHSVVTLSSNKNVTPTMVQTVVYQYKKEETPMSNGLTLLPVKGKVNNEDMLLGNFIFSPNTLIHEMPVGFIPNNLEIETLSIDSMDFDPNGVSVVVYMFYYEDADFDGGFNVPIKLIYFPYSPEKGVKVITGAEASPDFTSNLT